LGQPLTKEQRIAGRRRAWSLRLRGWTEQRIADDVGVNQSTVSRWLDQMTRRAIDQLDARITREFIASLGQLDTTIDEAFQAWERSKKPKRKASQRSGSPGGKAGGGPGETRTAEQTDRDGDRAFLDLFLAAWDRKRQLLSLDERFAPPKDDDQAARAGGPTVLDAVAAAMARDAAYQPDDPEEAETDDVPPE
jgi:predicted transcriptional regulator